MIGRKEEAEALKAAFEATESQFVAIYGRRRVGKTYLVRQVLGPEFLMEHVGPYNGSFENELEAFHDSLVTWGYSECPRLTSWKQAFGELEKHIRTSNRSPSANAHSLPRVVRCECLAWRLLTPT